MEKTLLALAVLIALVAADSAIGDGLGTPYANFASPPALGNVTPNVVNATTFTATGLSGIGAANTSGRALDVTGTMALNPIQVRNTNASGSSGIAFIDNNNGAQGSIYWGNSTQALSMSTVNALPINLIVNGTTRWTSAPAGNTANGPLGITGTTTTATNTASMPAMVIPAGTLTTTPANGYVENNGTALYYTNSSGTRQPISTGGSATAPLSATTGNIGGSQLLAGACTNGTVAVAGSTTSMHAGTSPVSDPGTSITWEAFVSAAGTVTVRVCALVAATPNAVAYNVRVIQ